MKSKGCSRAANNKFMFALAAYFSCRYRAHCCFRTANSLDLDRGHVMLRTIKDDLKKNYYDPHYHDMDVDARFKAADEKINQATSLGQILGIVAQVLLDLNDSHTFFMPPGRSYQTEYGWQGQMIGDKCYVMAVKPGSDADAKGLKPGDEVSSADGVRPTRQNMWVFDYLYRALRPRPGIRLTVIKPDGQQQQLDVMAKVEQGRRVRDLTDTIDLNNYIREEEGRLVALNSRKA